MNGLRIAVLAVAVVAAFGMFFIACEKKTTVKAEALPAAGQKVVYTCPMHPEVISDKPGKCPKCGMNLVLKK
jgi:Zn finger protein HypA/HybF involved in hydrogenase expression